MYMCASVCVCVCVLLPHQRHKHKLLSSIARWRQFAMRFAAFDARVACNQGCQLGVDRGTAAVSIALWHFQYTIFIYFAHTNMKHIFLKQTQERDRKKIKISKLRGLKLHLYRTVMKVI